MESTQEAVREAVPLDCVHKIRRLCHASSPLSALPTSPHPLLCDGLSETFNAIFSTLPADLLPSLFPRRHMQHPASKNRKKKREKSVFDASHFEESDDSQSSGVLLRHPYIRQPALNRDSGVDRKYVRFKRPSTPPRSAQARPSKSTCRCFPTLRAISLLLLPLIISATIGLRDHISPYIGVAIDFAKPLIDTASSSLACTPQDGVPPHIAEYVHRAISTALGTTIQRPNFALRTSGAIIVTTFTTSPEEWSCEPEDLLEEDDGAHPCCFFAGDRAQVAVRLSQLIRPTHVTIDYVLPARTMSRNAPRRLVLWGLVDGAANKALFKSLTQFHHEQRSLGEGPPNSGRLVFLPFADFAFDAHAAFPIQTFPIHSEIVFSGMSSGFYILEIRSNWGGNLTGIRRLRLHGEQVS